MLSKTIKKVKSVFSFSLKLFILTSFLISQSFISEIFLYQNNLNTKSINIAKADYSDHWYNNGWSYREEITIPRSNIPHTDTNNSNAYLSNFPVLVSINISTSKARNDHNDIIFTNQGGTQLLNYEIENYDGSGNLVAWVQIPYLNDINNTADTSFYIYYGNSGYTTANTTSVSVWDSSFKGVWHLGETGTAHASDYKDSTTNANNSANAGNQPIQTASGQMDGAQIFNGTSSYINVANNGSLNNITNALTIEAWIKPNLGAFQKIITKDTTWLYEKQPFNLGFNSGGSRIVFFAGDGTTAFSASAPSDNTAGAWSHIVATYDGSAIKVYKDGVAGSPTARTGNLYANNTNIQFGGWSGYNFSGSIDEVRISDVARSADWIKTEYNNEHSPSTFMSLGAEEALLVLSEVIPVPNFTNNTTPSYTFNSTKAGTIAYSGDCSSTITSAAPGNNTITFNTLTWGVHSNCTIQVSNAQGEHSNTLAVTSFAIIAPWYSTSWPYRKSITIDYSKVPNTDQSNFPVLVTLTDNSLKTITNGGKVANSHGYDIVFVSQDNTTQLSHEIESYDGVNGTVIMWVKVPTLSHTVNTIVYMYYGNPNITTSQENKTAVWDSDYKGIWHLRETGAGHASDYKDSTTNANNSTNAGNQPIQTTDGQMDGAQTFNGTSSYINVLNSASLNITNALTIEAWIKPNLGAHQKIITKDITWLYEKQPFNLGFNDTGSRIVFYTGDGTNELHASAPNDNTAGAWSHVVATYDGTAIKVYKDGIAGSPTARTGNLYTNNTNIQFGSWSGYDFSGSIDEVRISDVARSADWIKTEYNNESNPSSFYVVGGEDYVLPALSEVTPVPTPTNSLIPSYTFSSTRAGTITYGGDCSSATTSAVLGNNAITFNALQEGTHFNCIIRVTDGLGNQSNTLSVTSFTITNTPVIDSVTTTVASGNYGIGTIIPIAVNFSKAVTSTGNVTVTLNTTPQRSCTFMVDNATSGSCTYTVQNGDIANSLNTAISGTIQDQLGNSMDSFNPASNLSGSKTINIDTIAPILTQVTPVSTPTNITNPSYTFSSTKSGAISYGGDCSSSTTSAVLGNTTVTFNVLSIGTHSNCTIKVTDGLGNQSSVLSVSPFTINSLFTTYVVPAITDNKILPKSSIPSSYISDTISAQASSGEYKAESFVVNSNQNINTLQIETSSLSGSGNVIPSSAIDIKTVKCWYQGGYGTGLYPQGRYLTPELLLKDDSLVNVDEDNWNQWYVSNPNGKNYLKLTNGSYVDIWSDASQNLNPNQISISDRPVQDATTLQPVNLPAYYNKQFWITLHVPDNTPAGNYSGTISLKNGNQTIKTISINIQVLPFSLPLPNAEYDIYYRSKINGSGSVSSEGKTVQQYTAEQQNMQSHGVTNPTVYPFDTDSNLLQELSIRQQAGLDNTNMYYVGSIASNNIAYYKNLTAPYGVVNLYQYGPDESSLNDSVHRTQVDSEHSAGGRHFTAQNISQADSVADILDLAVVSGLSSALADKYHSYGHKVYAYAIPQTVSEYPQTFRKNYGLALWQNNYDGAMVYAYQHSFNDIWNDFDSSMRDHAFAYPTMNGVIDTIQWEGFREGINDMRYLAALQNAITAAKGQGKDTTEAEAYLANLKSSDLTNRDLDAIRSQMINYILALPISAHSLTVTQGTSSGFYTQDTQITVTANAPQADMVFDKWTGDTQCITDLNAISTTVRMPSNAVSLTATYKYKVISVPWYNNNYLYRKAIIINCDKVSNTDQSNFPVLISLTDASLRNIARGGKVQNSHGYDIIFTLSDGTLLNYEVESYDNTTGRLVAWVKMPTVFASHGTPFYMYYGNSSITTSQENKTAVWDSDYKGIWHLGETGAGHASDYKDSTTNANNSTNAGNQPIQTTDGQMDGAQTFNGTSSYINVLNSASLNITNALTIEAWIKPNLGAHQKIITKDATLLYEKQPFNLGFNNTGNAVIFYAGNGTTAFSASAPSSNTAGVWSHIVAVYDGAAIKVYKDGVAGSPTARTGNLYTDNTNIQFGQWGSGFNFSGSIDEVRISDVARSADWIKTEYNNEHSLSSFYTVGEEENIFPPTIISISANLPNGAYGTGTVVPITVNFSKPVLSSGTVTVILNTNPQRFCTFSANNSSSASCIYTVQGGDYVKGLSATISGSIQDQFGNTLVNFIPTSNISDNTTIDIDTSSSPFIPPAKPNISNIKVNGSNATLNISNLPNTITQIAISTTEDFKNVSWQAIKDMQSIFSKYTDAIKLYLKFRSSNGAVSDILIYENNNIPSNYSYPAGTLLKLSTSPKIYVVIDDKKKWISTPQIFTQLGYKWTDIQTVTDTQLSTLSDYEDNLIREKGDYKVYLVVNGVKRHIPSPAIFLDYGFSWNDIKDVDNPTINKYQDTYLIKENGRNEIYYVNLQGVRKLVPTTEIFNSYGDKQADIQIVSKKEIDSYPLSNLIKLNGSNDVYLIQGNIKKKIPNIQTFNKYKLNWSYVILVNQTEFNWYKDGGILR